MTLDLPLIWAGLIAFAVLAYVAALAIYLKDVFAVNDGLRFMHDSINAALEARRRRGP
jgi:hypothetical protein